jgi:hypothetical protein
VEPGQTTSGGASASNPRRTSWFERFGWILLVLLAFGYFVVKPWAEHFLSASEQAVNSAIESFATGVAELARVPYDEACRRIDQSAEVKAMFGGPAACARFEDSTWLDARAREERRGLSQFFGALGEKRDCPPLSRACEEELEFTFEITGPNGSGQAHAVAAFAADGFQLKRLEVSGPAGQTIELSAN